MMLSHSDAHTNTNAQGAQLNVSSEYHLTDATVFVDHIASYLFNTSGTYELNKDNMAVYIKLRRCHFNALGV